MPTIIARNFGREMARLEALVREYDLLTLRLHEVRASAPLSQSRAARTAESQAMHACATRISHQWWLLRARRDSDY